MAKYIIDVVQQEEEDLKEETEEIHRWAVLKKLKIVCRQQQRRYW